MQIKNLGSLLEEANKIVTRLSYDQTCSKIKNGASIIDVREEIELKQNGMIKNAIHIPRGLIEFKLSLNSVDNPNNISENSTILVYCAGGFRSALAAKTLIDLGFKNVFNIGGFDEWVINGGETQTSLNY
tara:strand:- start:663 stop:1052 length:390 start_codon:yes stop_codon:yes gene_type:complete